MKLNYLLSFGVWLLCLVLPAHAAFFGRLPVTPGGIDYQAYYDDQLNITWTTNANINGLDTWDNHTAWISALTIGGVDGWRLPSMDVNGDGTIVDCSTATAAACLDNEYGYMFYQNGVPTISPGPFIHLQPSIYWSATEFGPDPDGVWAFFFNIGFQNGVGTFNHLFAWPVHSGDVLDDTDGDGIDNTVDNCLLVVNAAQRDTDGDGVGNFCDPDVNAPNDCTVDFLDLNVYRANFFMVGDRDTDNNGDGLTNFADLSIVRAFFDGPPGPSAAGCD